MSESNTQQSPANCVPERASTTTDDYISFSGNPSPGSSNSKQNNRPYYNNYRNRNHTNSPYKRDDFTPQGFSSPIVNNQQRYNQQRSPHQNRGQYQNRRGQQHFGFGYQPNHNRNKNFGVRCWNSGWNQQLNLYTLFCRMLNRRAIITAKHRWTFHVIFISLCWKIHGEIWIWTYRAPAILIPVCAMTVDLLMTHKMQADSVLINVTQWTETVSTIVFVNYKK